MSRPNDGVTLAVVIVVAIGVGLAVVTAVAGGFDATSGIILGGMIAVGGLGIAVARRAAAGAVAPVTCAECDGLVSPSAPYCKHCGAPARRSRAG